MVGLNGALVALLCVAYFVLMVCVLTTAGGSELARHEERLIELPVDELALRRRQRARRSHPSMSPPRPRPYHHRDAS